MGDHGDGSTGYGRGQMESIREQPKSDASAYNAECGGERFRVVVVIDGERYVCEKSHDRVTSAMNRVVEIERALGVNAFALHETTEALR